MTYIGGATAISRHERVDSPSEVRPRQILHVHRRIIRPSTNGAARPDSRLRLRTALIDVRLGDKDRERNIIQPDVGPGNVLREALPTLPGLETRAVHAVHDRDIVEGDVGDVGKLSLILAKATDAHTVSLISDGTALEENIVRTVADRDGVVSVVDDAVGDPNMLAGYIEAIGVEGKAAGRAVGIDDRIGNVNIGAGESDVPRYGFAGLEVLHTASLRVERHEMRSAVKSSARVRVGIPPCLPVRVDPSCRDIRRAFVLDVGASERKPVQVCGPCPVRSSVVQLLDVGDVLW